VVEKESFFNLEKNNFSGAIVDTLRHDGVNGALNVTLHKQFYLGPISSGAPFHYHCDALNLLVQGKVSGYNII
jgi:hypothetical protein